MCLPDNYKLLEDISYTGSANPRQFLDIAYPENKTGGLYPVILFIHGGAWMNGSKEDQILVRLAPYLNNRAIGIAINYRLSDEAIWPAQLEDCKSAIDWICENADKFNIDTDKICVWGSSAGGHLAAMLGVKCKSSVSAVINQYGPSQMDIINMDHFKDHELGNPLEKLVGGTRQEKMQAVIDASPFYHIDGTEPPFLNIHGENDPVVEYEQSVILNRALREAGATSYLIKIVNGVHSLPDIPELKERISQFLDKHLFGLDVAAPSEDPVIAPPE